jgi:hypothetical protein
MSKQGQSKRKLPRRRKKSKASLMLVVLALVAGLVLAWIFLGGDSPEQTAANEAAGSAPETVVVPGLEDRMVLPAGPRIPRPITLNPAAFDDPETKASYQAAKDSPEALENVACYCGCFGNSGHRNNLDCFTDNHGVT